MKKAALLSFSLVILLSGCKKKADVDDVHATSPTGKNLLTTLVSYEVCATSLSVTPEEAKTKLKRLEALKSNQQVANLLGNYDTECTEGERKMWYDRMLCAEKACKMLKANPGNINAHIHKQCPGNEKAPDWSKKCGEVYDKFFHHIRPPVAP